MISATKDPDIKGVYLDAKRELCHLEWMTIPIERRREIRQQCKKILDDYHSGNPSPPQRVKVVAYE